MTEQANTQGAVLLVEEGGPMWTNMRRALQKDGFSLRSATTLTDALDNLRKEDFDIVITGLSFRDRSGLDVLRQIKEAAPLSELIVLTDSPSPDPKWEALKLGAYDYLTTPIEEFQIRDVARKALMHRNLRVNFREPPPPNAAGPSTPAETDRPSPRGSAGRPSPAQPAPFSFDREDRKLTFWWKENEDLTPAPTAGRGPSLSEPAPEPPPAPPRQLQRMDESPAEPEPPPPPRLREIRPPEVPVSSPSAPRQAETEPTPPPPPDMVELQQELEDRRHETERLRERVLELEPLLNERDHLRAEVESLRAAALHSQPVEGMSAPPPPEAETTEAYAVPPVPAPSLRHRLFPLVAGISLLSILGAAYFGAVAHQREREADAAARRIKELMQTTAAAPTPPESPPPAAEPTLEPAPVEPPDVPATTPSPSEAPATPWAQRPQSSPLGLPEGLVITVRASNLREGPGIHTPRTARLPAGTLLQKQLEEDEWARVRSEDGREGYMWTPNLSDKAVLAAATGPVPPQAFEQGGHYYPSLNVLIRPLLHVTLEDFRFQAVFMRGSEPWESVDLSLGGQPGADGSWALDLLCPRGIPKEQAGPDFRVEVRASSEGGRPETLASFPLFSATP